MSEADLMPLAYDVRSYGARGDGATLDTAAIQAAIDACADAGGGTVLIPAGRYVTGSIELRSRITLALDAGATLLGSENPADYPIVSSRWEGREQLTYASLISGRDLHRIAIVGRGLIDGRGAGWWRAFRAGTLAYPRPRLIAFADCRDVLIEGVTAINSPSWTINPVRCDNVTIDKLTIRNPADSPNTDGINPDSCSDVHISNCSISVGDDCITLKSGIESEDPARRRPCRNITITNCTMADGHGGVVIGSEMSGDVRNVVIANCIFTGTDRGIRLKSRRGRGGVVEDVQVTNVVMRDVLCPFTMNLYYACGAWGDATVADKRAQPIGAGTPSFRRIRLSHLSAHDVKVAAAFVYGLAEMPLEDVTLSDVTITLAAAAQPGYPDMADDLELMQRAGFFARNVRGLRLHNVAINGQLGPALRLSDASEIELSGFATRPAAIDAPAMTMHNVADAFVHGCRVTAPTATFVQLTGAETREITLAGNQLRAVRQPIQVDDEVRTETITIDGARLPIAAALADHASLPVGAAVFVAGAPHTDGRGAS